MLNNKGQSLILFIIILPVLLIILVLVIDIGRVIVMKQELDNINRIVLDYGIDYMYEIDNNGLVDSDMNNEIYIDSVDNNIKDLTSNDIEFDDIKNEIRNIINLNKDDIDIISINIDDGKIYIVLEDSVKGIFSKLIDVSIFKVKSSFVGYMENNNKRIERVSGDQ